jgi:hypothetical protein
MKGDLTGWFEVRVDGPRRHHYRLFCRLDYDAQDQPKPLLVVISGDSLGAADECVCGAVTRIRASCVAEDGARTRCRAGRRG